MSKPTADELNKALEHALQLHGSGNLNGAERLYRQILSVQPEQPVALHYLGVIALQVGQPAAAIELIEKAVNLLPDYGEALGNLGNAQQSSGLIDEAIISFEKALLINPEVAMIRANLANARCQLDQFEAAIVDYEAALALQPGLFEVHRNLASALLKLERPADALQSITKAAELKPDSVAIQLTMGNVLQELSRLEEAADCFRGVLKQQPGIAEVHCNLANVLREMGQLENAVSHYEKALSIKPDYAEGHFNLAVTWQEQGELGSAINELRQAIQFDPSYAKAHRMLAGLIKHSAVDDDIGNMEKVLNSPDVSDEQKMHISFGLGKSYADLKQYDQAFEYYRVANTIKRNSFDYSIDDEIAQVTNLKSTFTEAFFAERQAIGLPDKSPIFIIGMPRSGTTLVEQILASHPDVYGAGELQDLQLSIAQIFGSPNGVDFTTTLHDASADSFGQAGQLYLSKIREKAPSVKFITDKLPMNFLYVGMIKLMLPKVRIIHCQRDPMDTCFSIYKNFFSEQGHSYAYDLKELGTFYNLYVELMAHWQAVIPGFITTIEYEKLVAEQESESRKLLSACGLDWDPACLEFHKTRRQVATLSAAQVRSPIYANSVRQWQHYNSHLAPLAEALRISV